MNRVFVDIFKSIFHLKYKKIIIFEDVNGFTGNAGAIYDYMINNDKYSKYKYVWLVVEKTSLNSKKRKYTSVYTFNSKKIMYHIYRNIADIILYDNCYVSKYHNSQKTYYLTHGSPCLKNVKGLINMRDDLDFLICGSNNTIDTISYQYTVSKDKFVILGQPRNDYLFNIDEITKKFVSDLKYKIIVWAPTFRKKGNQDLNDSNKEYSLGIPLINNYDEFENLNEFLINNKIVILLKSHPVADTKSIKIKSLSNIKIMSQNDIDNFGLEFYSIMGCSVAMLTDYSSISFDYMLLNRPIGYIIDDIDNYKRGFAFENYMEMMPGKKIKTLDDLKDFIIDVANGKDEYKDERNKVRKFTNDYAGNENCKRLVEYFDL